MEIEVELCISNMLLIQGPSLERQNDWSSGSQLWFHTQIPWGAVKAPCCPIPPQRFQSNWPEEWPGHQKYVKAPQVISKCSLVVNSGLRQDPDDRHSTSSTVNSCRELCGSDLSFPWKLYSQIIKKVHHCLQCHQCAWNEIWPPWSKWPGSQHKELVHLGQGLPWTQSEWSSVRSFRVLHFDLIQAPHTKTLGGR